MNAGAWAPQRAAVIGPGRMGGAVALALDAAGVPVVAVAGRGEEALQRFVALVPGAAVSDVGAAARAGDLVVVAVPDDAVEAVVAQVTAADAVREGSRWVHLAGSLGLAPLRPARLAGARVAACHPAASAPDAATGAAALAGAAWAVTADVRDTGWATALVTRLGGRPVAVADGARTLYHAALVLASNGTGGVVALARDLLAGAGVADPAPFLAPLATASVANVAVRGVAALTGPVSRGDAGTVARHVAELTAVLPEALPAYRALATLLLGQARRAGLDPAAAAGVARALEGDRGT